MNCVGHPPPPPDTSGVAHLARLLALRFELEFHKHAVDSYHIHKHAVDSVTRVEHYVSSVMSAAISG